MRRSAAVKAEMMHTQNARTDILNALEDLDDSDFQKFIFHLRNCAEAPRIRASEVHSKSRVQVAELLVSRCAGGAVDRTVKTLRAAGCNSQALELESQQADSKDPDSLDGPGPAPKPHSTNNAPKRPQKGKKGAPKPGKAVLQFGKYKSKSLEWVLQNEMGCAVCVVSTQQIESEERETWNQSQSEAHEKHEDARAEYVCGFSDAVERVPFHREGLAPVGFGKYKTLTREELYNSTGEEQTRYMKWLRSRKKTEGKPEMEATIKYIRYRDQRAPFTSTSSKKGQE